MENVIFARFGIERHWASVAKQVEAGLLRIGAHCGDDAELMRIKADRVMRLLRDIESGTSVKIEQTLNLPPGLTPAQLDAIEKVIREAVQDAARRVATALIDDAILKVSNAYVELCAGPRANGT